MGSVKKTVQFSGPFSAKQTFTLPAKDDRRYTHIGMQAPYKDMQHQDGSPEVSINGEPFLMPSTGILEYDEESSSSVTIKILRDLPAGFIIDVAYETLED